MIKVMLLIVSLAIILITLLQGGKTQGMPGALTGADSLSLFAERKERGSEKVISNLTMVLGVLFFILVIAIRVLD